MKSTASTATPPVRRFDPHTGAPGVIALPCTACHATVIIINANAYTGQPLYCTACEDLNAHPDTPIPYRLTPAGLAAFSYLKMREEQEETTDDLPGFPNMGFCPIAVYNPANHNPQDCPFCTGEQI